ncbi:hypothetical protein HY29_14390 [Hyphomonas beringensis]|uniref:Uncharacterized protein n=1 Tax=Hyphomonas beringensis TaxID=1280946 RepID=A0A062UDY9_9PROT|nr:hypothetical protein [Hyphomonas beringensis]KCZ54335.1 hypothetical protein HY29_14390 [Hyphomonas beringensis]
MKRQNKLFLAAGLVSAAGAAFAGQKYGRRYLRKRRAENTDTTARLNGKSGIQATPRQSPKPSNAQSEQMTAH